MDRLHSNELDWAVINAKEDIFCFEMLNKDICEDFHLESIYKDILGQGIFSEVWKLTSKRNKLTYAVKTFRLP